MKKLYKSGNYLIIDKGNGKTNEYPCMHSVYTLNNGAYEIKEHLGGKTIIPISEISSYFDILGTTAFTEETLVEFLRENTAFRTGGGNGFGVTANKVRTVNSEAFDILREDDRHLINEQYGGNWSAVLPRLTKVPEAFTIKILYKENDDSVGTIQPYANETIDGLPFIETHGKGSIVITKLNDTWFVESQVSYDFLPQQGKPKIYEFTSKSDITITHNFGYIPIVEVWIETEGEFINSNVDISHDWDNKNYFSLELGSNYNGKIIYI
tara:strand:- start:265 stop:1065 length:801 start_codon:yes stop_codon:yes gene_type:complete